MPPQCPPVLLQRFIKSLEGNSKPGFVAVLNMAAGGSELL